MNENRKLVKGMYKKEIIGQSWQKQEDGSYRKVGGYKIDSPEEYIIPWFVKFIAFALIIALIIYAGMIIKVF